jgi:hypothetical protein
LGWVGSWRGRCGVCGGEGRGGRRLGGVARTKKEKKNGNNQNIGEVAHRGVTGRGARVKEYPKQVIGRDASEFGRGGANGPPSTE